MAIRSFSGIALVFICANVGAAWSGQDLRSVVSYKCVNKSGLFGNGTGRPSQNNEYSDFLKRYVRAGEYVVFRYDGAEKEYWFKASSCSLVNGKNPDFRE